MKTVTVITPTIGKPELVDAIKSVQNQTYKTKHLIVVDGPQYDVIVAAIFGANFSINEIMSLGLSITPENTGANGFNGQRIYASYPHLINSDYIAFLDEDNWYEPDHIQSLVEVMEANRTLDFAYSLRKIHNKTGEYQCNDDCESLGHWAIFDCHLGRKPHYYLIDTSCYFFRREFLIRYCHLWHSGPWGEDRRFLGYMNTIKANYATNGKYTLCYRLEGNPGSVTKEFFEQGNNIQQNHYEGGFPWRSV